ncbi:SPOR domain-containing protein [Dysgonomonas sp. 521]|uniref:SPOR domain-containing protein n=1 Tax=Dysgonomonas sp. 521 TaxID=2302932 RepID=UPI0013D4A5BB|nr:SPOR domain-containing protein [Dysgonomonas sp. 521]NDV97267.1 SPOR domain-containing protein [Dysgonomonas sp. 521]
MKKSFYIFFFFALISACAFGQNDQKSIVDELNSSRWGQGNVKVMQDDLLRGKLAVSSTDPLDSVGKSTTHTSANTNVPAGTKVREYKIQVFMGNNQQQSKREAESKQAQIKSAYPELKTSVSFQSPFWRLRVGNFRTKEEAQAMMQDMKRTFPSFGREMTIVSEVVKR